MIASDKQSFVCSCAPWMRSACLNETVVYKIHDGKPYCVLHYPGEEKEEEFQRAVGRKVQARKFDFGGVFFPLEANFSGLTMGGASFRNARIKGRARFNQTKFVSTVDFSNCEFADADFSGASFMGVNFIEAKFGRAFFFNARFGGDANFNPTQFATRSDFGSAEFLGRVYFGKGVLTGAYFGNAKFYARADFGKVKFGCPNFANAQFKANVNFGGATFSGTPLFESAQFEEADFRKAEFCEDAIFKDATFAGAAHFEGAILPASVSFDRAEFESSAYFEQTRFAEVGVNRNSQSRPPGLISSNNRKIISFNDVRFKEKAVFESNVFSPDVAFRFTGATFDHPEHVTFHNVTLRPNWFINVPEASRLHFAKVDWLNLGSPTIISGEIETLLGENIQRPYESLEIACRQLAVNAEESNRFEEAARFRLIASGARRRHSWHRLITQPGELESWRRINPLLWVYGLLSGYGERAWQAALVLVGICFLFAAIFFFGQQSGQWWKPSSSSLDASSLGQQSDQPRLLLGFREALIYSANVMTLQKPDPLPANYRARTVVLFATILGPLQAALLALAIRRKFMK